MEKVLLYFLEQLLVYEEYQGIDKMKLHFTREVQKASIDRELMMSIINQGSNEFLDRLKKLQSTALKELQTTFLQCKDENYFYGFTFEEFLKMYSIYIQGVISDSNMLSVKECLDLFVKMIMNKP